MFCTPLEFGNLCLEMPACFLHIRKNHTEWFCFYLQQNIPARALAFGAEVRRVATEAWKKSRGSPQGLGESQRDGVESLFCSAYPLSTDGHCHQSDANWSPQSGVSQKENLHTDEHIDPL